MITDINEIAEQCGVDGRDWFPDVADSPTIMILAACGEVGELANLQKKVERGDFATEEVLDKMVGEAMDALIYLFCYLDYEGQDVAALYEKIRENNVRRFGNRGTASQG
jgi:NTP pyrophosphatase (non-canonical NTP hydrolase)